MKSDRVMNIHFRFLLKEKINKYGLVQNLILKKLLENDNCDTMTIGD